MNAMKWILLALVILGLTALIAAFDAVAAHNEFVVVGGLLIAGLLYSTWDIIKNIRKK